MSLLLICRCESSKKQFVSASIPLPFFLAESYKSLRSCYDSGSCYWPLIVESLDNFRIRACAIVGDKLALAQVFLMVLRFFESLLEPG
jgi:hypothetical protein